MQCLRIFLCLYTERYDEELEEIIRIVAINGYSEDVCNTTRKHKTRVRIWNAIEFNDKEIMNV